MLCAGALRLVAQVGFLGVAGEGDAIDRADIDAGVAFDAEIVGEHRLHVAVQAAFRLGVGQLLRSKPSSTSALMSRSAMRLVAVRHLEAQVERDVVVVAPLVDAHLLRWQVHQRRRAFVQVLALAELVDRDRRLVAVRHRPDDVLRAERGVAAEEHFADRWTAWWSRRPPACPICRIRGRCRARSRGRRSPGRPPPARRRIRRTGPARRSGPAGGGPCRRIRPSPSRTSCR